MGGTVIDAEVVALGDVIQNLTYREPVAGLSQHVVGRVRPSLRRTVRSPAQRPDQFFLVGIPFRIEHLDDVYDVWKRLPDLLSPRFALASLGCERLAAPPLLLPQLRRVLYPVQFATQTAVEALEMAG
ncbi:hypothetical protein RM53_05495 [Brevundimonas nasdae]|uniref:Uncharacterized protein n=1 Tax=Brevundimonas nasdae TaxID=172043 RepID=A0A0B4CDX8_9CAUL|nr:hypothetical protein RM53_05495 [Brevundimonas nasdae]